MSERDAIRLWDAVKDALIGPEACGWTNVDDEYQNRFRAIATDCDLEADHAGVATDAGYFCRCGEQMPCAVLHELRVFNTMRGPRSR